MKSKPVTGIIPEVESRVEFGCLSAEVQGMHSAISTCRPFP